MTISRGIFPPERPCCILLSDKLCHHQDKPRTGDALYRTCVSFNDLAFAKITLQPVINEGKNITVKEHRWNDTDRENWSCTNRSVRFAHCPH